MSQEAIAAFVAGRSAEARRAFGVAADGAVLERFAREAALDLWMADPSVTVADARLALRRLHAAL